MSWINVLHFSKMECEDGMSLKLQGWRAMIKDRQNIGRRGMCLHGLWSSVFHKPSVQHNLAPHHPPDTSCSQRYRMWSWHSSQTDFTDTGRLHKMRFMKECPLQGLCPQHPPTHLPQEIPFLYFRRQNVKMTLTPTLTTGSADTGTIRWRIVLHS